MAKFEVEKVLKRNVRRGSDWGVYAEISGRNFVPRAFGDMETLGQEYWGMRSDAYRNYDCRIGPAVDMEATAKQKRVVFSPDDCRRGLWVSAPGEVEFWLIEQVN